MPNRLDLEHAALQKDEQETEHAEQDTNETKVSERLHDA